MTGTPLFDEYVILDWSAANAPKRGRDSIWFCHLAPARCARRIAALENPPTRRAAETRLREILVAALAKRQRLLLGCDFPMGYARGFATRLDLSGVPWRGVWDAIAELLADDEANRSNRFTVAAELNRRISGAAFPFWGCPARCEGATLLMRHHRRHAAEGLPERRLSDERLPRLQPGWKLAGAGSAGSQALTGIPVIRRLRDDPLLAPRTRLWPFETGLGVPVLAAKYATLPPCGGGDHFARNAEEGLIIITEVWPPLVPLRGAPGEVRDRAQVRTLAEHFAALDAAGALAPLFEGDPSLTGAERAIVEREEGWVLGAGAAPPAAKRRTTAGRPAPVAAAGPP